MKEEKIKELNEYIINSRKFNQYVIEAIVLTGSHVHCLTHCESDIDLFVVVQEKIHYIRHEVFYIKQQMIHVRICSLEKFLEDCFRYEQKRPAAYACKLIFEKTHICSDAINQTYKYLKYGPLKIREDEKVKLVATVKNEIRTIEGLLQKGNLVAVELLINEIVQLNICFYNDDNNYWMTNNNYLFDELKRHNKILGNLTEKIILDSNIDEKYKNLKKMCDMIYQDFNSVTGEYTYDEYY